MTITEEAYIKELEDIVHTLEKERDDLLGKIALLECEARGQP